MSRKGNTMLNQEMLRNRQTGLCQMLQLKEENVRFVLLAVFLYIYLVFGALVFQNIEQSREKEMKTAWGNLYQQFLTNFSILPDEDGDQYPNLDQDNENPNDHEHQMDQNQNKNQNPISNLNSNSNSNQDHHHVDGHFSSSPVVIRRSDLDKLLEAYGEAAKAGVTGQTSRDKWDYTGSFYFSWTVVSTIGYGAITPRTTLGKLLIIPYGFFGCAGGLLFFNLFLERIITFLATCMRFYRIQRQKRRPFISGATGTEMWGRRTSHSSADNGSTAEDQDWKPSVYWVMLCLFIMSAIVIFSSAGIFHNMEGWTYIESLYFCFVSYATIGFGDLVLLQKDSYDSHPYIETLYRMGAFVITVFGCCCIYSLLNVTSIVIKQSLNWIIKGMDCQCCFAWCQCSSASIRRRFSTKRGRRKRGSRYAGSRSSDTHSGTRSDLHGSGLKKFNLGESRGRSNDDNANSATDLEERRYSGENMISIPRELNNKVSLAVMQKKLYEMTQAHHNRSSTYDIESRETFSATSVGPLAIVTEKLGGDSGFN